VYELGLLLVTLYEDNDHYFSITLAYQFTITSLKNYSTRVLHHCRSLGHSLFVNIKKIVYMLACHSKKYFSLLWGKKLKLAYSSSLKMEAVCSSEMSINFYQTTWNHNPKESTLQKSSL
jgi:hypothetical protein